VERAGHLGRIHLLFRTARRWGKHRAVYQQYLAFLAITWGKQLLQR